MVETIPTVLGVGAGVLMLTAMYAMYVGNLTVAGMSFLSASLVIYLRETKRQTKNSA